MDGTGQTVTLEQPARRIASLVPSQTDIILALGAADRLVARTQWDEDPRLADLPSTGNALMPSVEWLAAQQPELILAWPDKQARTAVSRLRDLGFAVYAARVQTRSEIEQCIAQIGTLLGIEESAERLIASIHAEIDGVRAAVEGRARPDVVYLVGVDPPIVAASDTYIDEIIEIAGGRNAFGDAPGLWPTVSLEEIVRRAPAHVIVATSEGSRAVLESLRSRPGWRDVPAVREGRVHSVDDALFNRPGPRLGEAARLLSRLLHADAGRGSGR